MSNPIDKMLDAIEWEPLIAPDSMDALGTNDGTPMATHKGVLVFGEKKLRVYQLDNGKRVIDSNDLANFFSPDCELCGKPMGDESGDVHSKCADYENAIADR